MQLLRQQPANILRFLLLHHHQVSSVCHHLWLGYLYQHYLEQQVAEREEGYLLMVVIVVIVMMVEVVERGHC